LLGFLVFNFNPASIFLGDSGSLLLGFLLGCNSIMWSGTSETVLQMAAPLMALAVPLIDTTLAIARRFLRDEPIFKADRSHIHHRLLARGLSHRRTVLLLYVIASIAGSLALCLIWARDLGEGVVIAAFTCAVIFGIRKLGYSEFDALRRVIMRVGIRREIKAQLALEAVEESLAAAKTADETWAAIQTGCVAVGFQAIRMQLAGRQFRCSNERTQETWVMRIPITESDWINISRTSSSSLDYSAVAAPLANTMRRVLSDKKFSGVAAEDKTGFFSASQYTTAA
jgi:UDP-GlcNAc:undecaprenyl-phosphate GlcNAc-1-phosphate transferase